MITFARVEERDERGATFRDLMPGLTYTDIGDGERCVSSIEIVDAEDCLIVHWADPADGIRIYPLGRVLWWEAV